MNKLNLTIGLYFIFLFSSMSLHSQYSLRMTTGPHIMVHPEKPITFGNSTSSPNNGAYSIEQYWGGLNFWKAWPTYANGNFKMHLNDLGMLGVNIRSMTRTYTGSCQV